MKTPRNESDKELPKSDIAAAAADGPWTETPTRVSRGPLVPCPSCKRHVFASAELSCPFCLSALPADLAQRAAPSTTTRMSRGDVFYFNARNIDANALSAVAGGVGLNQFGPAPAAEPGSNYGTGLGIGNWGELGGDHGATTAAYGSPVPGLGGEFEPYHPGEDPGGGAAMYGAPAEPGDWTTTDPGGGAGTMYGAPGEWSDPGSDGQHSGDDGMSMGSEHGDYSGGVDGGDYTGGDYNGGDYSGGVDGGDYNGGDYNGGDDGGGGGAEYA